MGEYQAHKKMSKKLEDIIAQKGYSVNSVSILEIEKKSEFLLGTGSLSGEVILWKIDENNQTVE